MNESARDKLPPRYEPHEIEDRRFNFWVDGGYFHSEPDDNREPFTIVIPPPNVTAILHIGHALNNVIQDIIIRFKRMRGYNALWLPGTDHAGIATQNVVERQLASEGKTRWDLGREEFIKRVWQWRSEYGSRIIEQLKKLGCSCDWERERFTMDEGLSRAVREAFVTFYEQGLIHRGNFMINWCPRCGTALSDDEVEHEEREGQLWYIRYPFKENKKQQVVVATTRPETMLGDTAVAVHPDDSRYKEHIGKTIILPVIGREIPIVADERVDPEFGTGAVKITPGHDPNDFEIGRAHNLELIQVIGEDGNMTTEAGDYAGMDRYECREALIEELKEKLLLERTEPHNHAVGHCYRCHVVIEPYVNEQWFVKMKPLAERALSASDKGEVQFFPPRWEKVYRTWLENVRDWCISRQIWWGHRIPAWYCDECGHITVSREDAESCGKCSSKNIRRDEDVLDTWFSSALWPFSTLGWPEKTEDLDYYYPTNTLVTDRGIIYLWVARMVMDGLNFMGQVPFSDVFIHATILDETGRKMSKSLGNGIDPVEMIDKYGTDAVRYSLMMLTVEQQDVRLSEKKFEIGRNFANKVWNASRFVLINLEDSTKPEMSAEPHLTTVDRWIMSRLGRTVEKCTTSLDGYRFNDAATALYDFTWREFCDWYVEIVKPRLMGTPEDARTVRGVLVHVMDTLMRLLHPFAPFISEEIWQHLRLWIDESILKWDKTEADALITAAWPNPDAYEIDESAEDAIETIQGAVRSIRDIRAAMNIPDSQELELIASSDDETNCSILRDNELIFRTLAGVGKLIAGPGMDKPPAAASDIVAGIQLYIPLEGIIDLEQERKRIENRIAKAEKQLASSEAKLKNEKFLANAPANVIEKERERNRIFSERLEKLRRNLEDLA